MGLVFALAFFTGSGSALQVAASFNPQIGVMLGTAWDPGSGNVFVYQSGATDIREYTTAGSLVAPNIPQPGVTAQEFDMDFADAAFEMGRKIPIPAGSLLIANGDDAPNAVYAVNKHDGTVLEKLTLQVTNTIGITHHATRGTFFLLDFSTDRLTEINPLTGSFVGQFPIAPTGSPTVSGGSTFGVFHGDVEVHPASGNLWVGGSEHEVIRELSPTGAYLADIDLSALDLNGGISGLSFDNSGALWLTTDGGYVYKLTDLFTPPTTSPPPPTTTSPPPPPECSESGSICTGDEDDEVEGTSSANFIYTGAGNDTISAGGGDDTIEAGDGDDGIAAGAGADLVDAGAGNDSILGDSPAPTWARLARFVEGTSGDELDGGEGNDEILGEAGGDELSGDDGIDELFGGAGVDVLRGGDGKDILSGGSGVDILNGGGGRDTCTVTSKKEQRKAKNCERFRRNF